MAKLIIDTQQHAERAALVDDKEVVTFYISRRDNLPAIGDIYIGSVSKVNDGLQGVFVDFGNSKHGFLHKQDTLSFGNESSPCMPLSKHIQKGDRLIVQVVREQTKRKGAKLTQYIQLSNDYIVYLPYSGYIAVSKQITGPLKEKLRHQVSEWCSGQEGAIIRTNARNLSLNELEAQFFKLKDLWGRLLQEADESGRRSFPLYTYDYFVQRIVGENTAIGVDEIIINKKLNEPALKRINGKIKITLKPSDNLFELYGIESAFKKALKRKIYLKSGAYIVIDYTESLTAIDVNTGRFSAESWEDTALQVNLEAADEIARQLRWRQIGGIIMIDFVKMENERNQTALLAKLKVRFANEKDTTQVLGFTKLGLVEMSRKKNWYGLQGAVLDHLYRNN